MIKKPFISSRKTFTVTPETISYIPLDPVVSIPSSDSTRYGRTLQSENLPVFSFPPYSVKYVEKCFVAIQNGSASTQTINWKLYKNNIFVTSSNGSGTVEAGYYVGITANFFDVSVGDVLEIAVWCTTPTSVNIIGHMHHTVPTRLCPTIKSCIDVSITTALETYPTVTGTTTNSNIYFGNSAFYASAPATYTFPALSFVTQNSYYISRYAQGDVTYSNAAAKNSHASNLVFLHATLPTSISYRELLL